MSAEWYNLFNKTAFEATGLVARTLVVLLESRGRQSFYITKANTLAITYDGEFLPVNFWDNNPFIKNGYAVYIDANQDVWFGFEVDP